MSIIDGQTTDVSNIVDAPPSHYDLIADGPFSTVSKVWVRIEEGKPKWVVIKAASTNKRFTREPHDILKELRLLSAVSHPNIIDILGSHVDPETLYLNIHMPYAPYSLAALLASPYFSPHSFPPLDAPDHDVRDIFSVLSRSVMFQILAALVFLHHPTRQIAHRDIKPENILLTKEGTVKLIDFGVSYKGNELPEDKHRDIWPEERTRLYFEVSTGAYRAPELLFGTREYDPPSIDIWSVGATFAEFFTSLRLSSEEDEADEECETQPDPGSPKRPEAFIVPRYLRIGYPGAHWARDTLFNGERGEIGLAWSIFKILGTPTRETWPEFAEFPGSKAVVFNIVPGVPLAPLLPNLPSGNDSDNDPTSPLDLLSKFLAYPPMSRLRPQDALRHAWFTDPRNNAPVLLFPRELELVDLLDAPLAEDERIQASFSYDWKGRTLGDLLEEVLTPLPEEGGSPSRSS